MVSFLPIRTSIFDQYLQLLRCRLLPAQWSSFQSIPQTLEFSPWKSTSLLLVSNSGSGFHHHTRHHCTPHVPSTPFRFVHLFSGHCSL
ncbi:hypothetical protein L2E82_39851 [Cichorium intybus]|uniref:Uncharacterized protein n=1 Tax=Cichorium intybus TaxID=13427 RepID=A0ACB9AK56_CICIN|nr:hypothetical protein L2E82_39851 [Cichorium intybus]